LHRGLLKKDASMETTGHRVDIAALNSVQRELRDRLLQRGRLHGEERGIAAEMLLYLEDAPSCWLVCANWVMAQTGADRVDGGFASAADRVYTPTIERRRDDIQVPSVLGTVFDAGAEAIRTVWRAECAVVYHDVQDDRRIDEPVRSGLLAAGTRSKIAVAVRDRGRDIGLMCVDSCRAFAWTADDFDRVNRLTREVIGPVLGAARELADAAGVRTALAALRTPPHGCLLTSAEQRVAQLVLAGCSYKEIAHKLDRACSTIDHQLRSMRQKLGVNSTAKLTRELASSCRCLAGLAGLTGQTGPTEAAQMPPCASTCGQPVDLPNQRRADGRDVRRAAGT
jgi:DNA-binding NarL/FixJ family response regulator